MLQSVHHKPPPMETVTLHFLLRREVEVAAYNDFSSKSFMIDGRKVCATVLTKFFVASEILMLHTQSGCQMCDKRPPVISLSSKDSLALDRHALLTFIDLLRKGGGSRCLVQTRCPYLVFKNIHL